MSMDVHAMDVQDYGEGQALQGLPRSSGTLEVRTSGLLALLRSVKVTFLVSMKLLLTDSSV